MASASAWKAAERFWSRIHGVERTGPRGQGLPDADPECGLAIEVKTQKKRVLNKRDIEQAATNAAKLGLPWVLILHELGTQYRVSDLIVMPPETYVELLDAYLDRKAE